jgi:hypothetical protein
MPTGDYITRDEYERRHVELIERIVTIEAWQRSALHTLASHGEIIAAVTKELSGVQSDLKGIRKDLVGAFRWLLGLIVLLGILNGAAVTMHH